MKEINADIRRAINRGAGRRCRWQKLWNQNDVSACALLTSHDFFSMCFVSERFVSVYGFLMTPFCVADRQTPPKKLPEFEGDPVPRECKLQTPGEKVELMGMKNHENLQLDCTKRCFLNKRLLTL